MRPNQVLIIGIKGHAVCIRKDNGAELWRTHLRGSGLTSILRDGKQIFAATRGYLYSLDLSTGRILWENGLPGLRFGPCVMGSPNQSAVATVSIIAQQAAVTAAVVASSAGAVAASSS